MEQRRKKTLRVPIFWKILGSCLFLAGALILASYLYTSHKMKAEGRGAFLDKHFARYKNYQEGLGQAVASVAEVLADDDGLRRALAAAAAASPAPTPDGTPGATPVPSAEDPAKTAATIAERMHKALSAKNSLRPDIFLVFGADGTPVYISKDSPIRREDLRELDAIARVRNGSAYFNRLIYHGDRVIQAGAVPILAPGKETPVGGILVGVYVERYFNDYKKQSDTKPKKQHRLVLVRNGEIIASTFDKSKWAELGAALKPEKRKKEKEGSGQVDVIAYTDDDGTLWDFHESPAAGFVGPSLESNMGTFYLLRTRDEVKQATGISGFAILSGIGGALLVAAFLAYWITNPVKKFIRATAQIADGSGDLTRRIDVDCNDELGDLADNLNKLFDNLYRLAHDVQGASFQVGASSAEISAASKQMLEGVKDQALKIEGSTAAVTELSSSIQQVASNAIEATKVAQQSNEAVTSAQESMAHIRRTVEEAADRITELGESGKRIGNIVEVIRQISEQTSLLALNASIEAAHAGEQGRGFAVVADEVSSLARRVGQSAKDIEDLIATIKDQTSDAVRAMQLGQREVESGTGMVTGTLANLKQIIEVVQDTANAVQEQAIVSDEIARNMDAVQKIANEVLASSEEAVIQGEQLHGLAYQLEESVRGFNLDQTSGGAEHAARPAPVHAEPPPRRPSLPPARHDGAAGNSTKTAGGKTFAPPRKPPRA